MSRMRMIIATVVLLLISVTLRAEPQIFTETIGTVIDARTKKPIGKFFTVLRPAQSSGASWQSHTLEEHSDPNGEFKIPLKKVWDEGAYVRVMAEGYKPGKARIDKATTQRVEIWLKPVEPITGRVVDANGKPIANAQVALASEFGPLLLESGHFKLNGLGAKVGQKVFKTAADGAFELPGGEDEALVVVAHDSGYGQVKIGAPTDAITLKPWARIQGRLLLGTKPGAGWIVSFSGNTPKNSNFPWVSQWTELTCDGQGKFETGPMVPDATLQASVIVKGEKNSAMVLGVVTFVETNPGQTLKLTLGGEGRPITGRLVDGEGKPQPGRKLWIRPPAPHIGFPGDDEMWKAQAEFFKAAQGVKYHHEIVTDADGRFRIERLPQGSFEIAGARLKYDQQHFEVKPMDGGKSDEALDLGELQEIQKGKQ